MTSIAEAAVAASVMLGLLTVPTASKTVDISEPVSKDLPNVSASESIPKEVSRSTSGDGFTASVKTAFNEFSTEVKHDSVEASLENPSSDLKVERTPEATRWELTTPSGTLTLEKSTDKTVERIETPDGTLEMVEEDGELRTSFEGSNREKVESVYHELRDRMDEKKKELERRRRRLKRSAMPEVEVIVNESIADTPEHAVLVNNGMNPLDIDEWKLSDEASTHEFGSVELEPGERLRVYSAEETEIEFSGEAVYDTGIEWNDGGDVATLENSKGRVIDRESY